MLSDELFWKALFKRDHGVLPYATPVNSWKKEYIDNSVKMTWDPLHVDDAGQGVWGFSNDNKKISRIDGRGFRPKAISAKPVRCRTLKFTLTGHGELGLFRTESAEAALRSLLNVETRTPIYMGKYFDNGCVFSTTKASVKVITEGNNSLVRLFQEDEYFTSLSDSGEELVLELDQNKKQVKWRYKEHECTTPFPGDGPIYAIYCTDYFPGEIEFI